jgi:hypothetical protein
MLLHFDPLDNTNIDVAKAFYQGIIFKAYGSCDVRDEAKHFWLRFEDEKENYSYYQFPPTENPIGYRTRLTKKDDPRSRETTGKAIALFDLLQELSSKPGNGVTFIPSSPPHFPIAERFNGSRIVHFEIDGASIESQRELINEMASVGLKATAIVNSGNKSIYPYFVTSENLTADQFRYLKRSFLPFDCDENIANSLIGGGRFAGVTRQSTGKEQSLESLNDITYSFSELSRLLELFYLSKNLEFESFEKYQARKEVESEKLQSESFNLSDYNGSDIEKLLIEMDGYFPPYQKGNQTYDYRKNIAIAIASLGLGDKAEELCPNLFSGTKINFSSLEKFKFNNPLGCILSQSRKWLNDSDLQYPDWFKTMYKQQKNNVIKGNFKNSSEFNRDDLLSDLKALLDNSFIETKLSLEINVIAAKYNRQVREIESLYNKLSNEAENESDRDFKKETLDKLNLLENQEVNLSEFLPKELATPLTLLANAYGTTPLALVSHLLPVVCVCLNPNIRLMLRPATKQVAKPILWTLIVGDPGSGKTPGNNLITDPYKKLQQEENERYKVELVDYERAHKGWEQLPKNEKKHTPEPELPKPKRVFFIDNITIEKLLKIQSDQPDFGLLWNKDEFSGLIDGLGQYKAKSNDQQVLLSLRSGEGFSVERVSKSLYAPHSTLSISGGIQPQVLKKRMGNLQDDDGFFSRFCFCFIGDRPNVITEGETIPDVSPMLEALYRQLSTISPQTFKLSDDAQKFYNTWYNRLDEARRSEPTGAMKAIYAKYKTVTGEIALALHCLWAAFYNQEPSQVVELATIQAAQKLTVEYLNQIKVFYQKEGTSEITPLQRILDMSQKRGAINASEVKRGDRFFRNYSPDTIRSLFNELTLMGKGVIQGTGKNIRFTTKVDSISEKLTENRQEVDNHLNPEVIDLQGLNPLDSKKIDKVDKVDTPNANFSESLHGQEKVDLSSQCVNLSTNGGQTETQQGIDTVDTSVNSCQLMDKTVNFSDEDNGQSEPDYWVNYNGQELKPDDFVHHRDYGTCKVILATGNTVKLGKDSVTISSDPSFLTHVWEPVADVS